MPGESGDLGEAYCGWGDESCWDGGRWGNDGAGGSSSESSGVNCGLRGGRLVCDGGKSVEDDLCCMMPAIAAAGPLETAPTGLDGCCGSTSLSEVCGDNAACGDFCSLLAVISM